MVYIEWIYHAVLGQHFMHIIIIYFISEYHSISRYLCMFGLTMWWEVNQFKEQNNLQLANIQHKKNRYYLFRNLKVFIKSIAWLSHDS